MNNRHEAALRAALAERDRLQRTRWDQSKILPASDAVVTRIVEAALAMADAHDAASEEGQRA